MKKANTWPRHFVHGMTNSREYRVWTNAKTRCFNVANRAYPRYGGRGITMCSRWAESFSRFYEDMGRCPAGKTLERRDVNGHYEPRNCYWATYQQQNNNRRDNKRVALNGISRTLAEWDRELGLNPGMVSVRLRLGMPVDRALTSGLLRAEAVTRPRVGRRG